MLGMHENPMVDTKIKICFYSVENYVNLLFDLEQIAAILNFTHNPMSKVLYCQTTMSETPDIICQTTMSEGPGP